MRCADQCIFGVLLACVLVTGCATSPDGQRPVTPARKVTPVELPVKPALQQAYNQALAHVQAGRNKEAEQALLALTKLAPELSGPYANLGIVYRRSGRMKEAIEALKRAIQVNPRRAVYYNELGIIYRQEGKFDDARRSYRKSLDLDPDYAFAQLNIAILYDLYLQDPKQALPHYQRYQQLIPTDDKTVNNWIIELQRRINPTKSTPAKGNS